MKKTLITAVALAACAGTQLFAQNSKEGVITFALTAYEQASVSTSPNSANSGLWSQGPMYYKSQTVKKSTTDVLKAIGAVLYHNGNAFSSKAQLVLVQGELGGFFNVGSTLGDYNGPETDLANGNDNEGFANVTDFVSTLEDIGAKLATGRHFRPNPINGLWPPGHHQPWGQIFVKDPAAAGHSATDPLCVNVTFFFGITVQECYDCLFLNSFVTDSKFAFKSNVSQGPPCCGVPTDLTGSGKDRYYMTLSFDNTFNNPYLDFNNDAWIGKGINSPWYRGNSSSWIVGQGSPGLPGLPGDGINPDVIPYVDSIKSSGVTGQRFIPNVLRFTLNGIVTYTWSLKKVNTSDLYYDFVGSASYAANGYGFADLLCALFTGSASIAEKVNKAANCCLDLPWYDSSAVGGSTGGWYGIGWNLFQDQYPLNVAAGDPEDGSYFASPVNIPEDISLHVGYNEWYEARYQWPSYSLATGDIPAQPESVIPTPFANGLLDSPYRSTRIPSARSWTDRTNTDWPDTGSNSPTYTGTP
jgi:hypothetical protein